MENQRQREKCVQSKGIKEQYTVKEKVSISKATRTELKVIHTTLANPKRFSPYTPVEYLVKRESDFTKVSDASLEVGGGLSENLF